MPASAPIGGALELTDDKRHASQMPIIAAVELVSFGYANCPDECLLTQSFVPHWLSPWL
jgi:cytochrome oxidase Cu insertion factor (SCO1/SenC/PrrC family)